MTTEGEDTSLGDIRPNLQRFNRTQLASETRAANREDKRSTLKKRVYRRRKSHSVSLSCVCLEPVLARTISFHPDRRAPDLDENARSG